jgi:radical SAM superfamily enzyme YgiQ (UPF0313 family)
MKVFLLNPITRNGTRTLRVGRCQGKLMVGLWPNIEYGYLTTLLREDGFQVEFLDANRDAADFESMLLRVQRSLPDIVFVCSITATLADDLEVGRRLTEMLPGVRVVFWGTHATVRPEDYLTHSDFLVIRREPEFTGLELCRALRDGATRFLDVHGVSHVHEGIAQHSSQRAFGENLECFPVPDYDEIGTGTHLATDTRRPFALVNTARGCPNACSFCTVHASHGARWRPQAVDRVIEDVRRIQQSTGVSDFFFQSDVFSGNRDWVVKLCEGLLASGVKITWFANSRVDCVDRPLLALMKRSGCRLVAFGVESGSDTVLTAVRKGATPRQAKDAIQACRDVGLPSLTYWVFGLPGETPWTMDETLALVKQAHPDYAHFYSPTPLPGSRLYEQLGIAAMVESGDLRFDEFFQGVSSRFIAEGVTRQQVERAILLAYLQFYSHPRRLLRELAELKDLRNLWGKAGTLATMVRNYVLR